MNVTSVYVEITNQCNLNCRTCYNRSGLNRTREELSCEDLEQLIQLFLPLGLKHLSLSGGEPTLHSAFNKVLGLTERYPQLQFSLTTNGTTNSRPLIDRMAAASNLALQISLDGSCEEVNAKTRGAGNFSRVMDLIRSLPAKKECRLKMVISQDNDNDIEAFYRLAVSLGLLPEFAFLFRAGNGREQWEDRALSPRRKMAALRLIDRLNKEYRMEAALPLATDRCPYAEGLDKLSLCVKPDGSIQPCQMLYGSQYSLGNIRHFDLGDFGVQLDRLSELAKTRLATDYACAKCLLKGSCGKGCLATAVYLSDDPLADDGDCELRRLQFVGLQAAELFHLKEVAAHGQAKDS